MSSESELENIRTKVTMSIHDMSKTVYYGMPYIRMHTKKFVRLHKQCIVPLNHNQTCTHKNITLFAILCLIHEIMKISENFCSCPENILIRNV